MNIRWPFFLNYNFFAVLFFTAIALFLNLMYLPLPSLWVDEAWLANVSKEPISVIVSKLLTTDAHLPVYYLIIKFTRLIFGGSEAALRFPALLFGLSLVPTVYFFGKELFSKRVGLWAAFLAATSYFIIWFSHQARMYTLTALLSVLSSYFFARLLKNFNRKNFLFYVLFGVLGVYTHYWLILVLFSHFAFLVLSLRKIKIRELYPYFLAQIIIFLFFLPWLLGYLLKATIRGSNAWIGKASVKHLFESFDYFTYGQFWIFFIFGLTGLVFLIIQKLKEKTKSEEIFGLFLVNCFFWVPLLTALLVSLFFPIYTPGRREIVVLPAFLVLAAYLFSRISSRIFNFFAMVLFLAMIIFKILNVNHSTQSYRFSDKIAANAILNKMSERDSVIFTDLARPTFEYYFDLEKEKSGLEPIKFSFPVFMQTNPTRGDWLDKLEADEIKSKEEAVELIDEIIKTGSNGKVFVIYRERPLDKLLIDEMNNRMRLVYTIQPVQPRMAGWFDSVLVFDKK